MLCPRCTRKIASEDLVCPFCGCQLAGLTDTPPPRPADVEPPQESGIPDDTSEAESRVPAFMRVEAMDRGWEPARQHEPGLGGRALRVLFFCGVGGAILFWIFSARAPETPAVVTHPLENRTKYIQEQMKVAFGSSAPAHPVDSPAPLPKTARTPSKNMRPKPPAEKGIGDLVYDTSLPPVKSLPAPPVPQDRNVIIETEQGAVKPDSEKEVMITGEGLKGTYFEAEGTPAVKGPWIFRGHVYDLVTLTPLDAVQIVLRNPETGKTYETYSQRGGRFRADVPETAGTGYYIRIVHAEYHSAYEFGRIDNMKVVPADKRKKIAQELSNAVANADPVLPAGKKKSLDIFITHR